MERGLGALSKIRKLVLGVAAALEREINNGTIDLENLEDLVGKSFRVAPKIVF